MIRAFALLVLLTTALSPALAGALLLESGGVISGPTVVMEDGQLVVRFENGAVVVPDGHARVAFRDDARDSRAMNKILEARGHRIWKDRAKTETESFALEGTIAPHVLSALGKAADETSTEVYRLLGTKRDPAAGRLAVRIYGDRQSYVRVAEGAGEGLGHYRFVPPRALHVVHDAREPARSRRVLGHLVTRAELDREGFSCPDFPSVALADHVSGAFDGELSERLRLDLAAERTPALRDVVVGRSDRNLRAWRWALVRFLLDRVETRDRLRSFVRAVLDAKETVPIRGQPGRTVASESVRVAFLAAFEGLDLGKMERDWCDFAKELRPRRPLALVRAAALAEEVRDRERAIALLRRAVATEGAGAAPHRELGRLLFEERDTRGAEREWRAALAKDPFDVATRRQLARALGKRGAKEDADRERALAEEIRKALEN